MEKIDKESREKIYFEIRFNFGGWGIDGSDELEMYVYEVLYFLPKNIRNFVTSNCMFVSDSPDEQAWHLSIEDIKKMGRIHIIFINIDLFKRDRKEIYWSILHEIGHSYLNHPTPMINDLTQEQADEQEKKSR